MVEIRHTMRQLDGIVVGQKVPKRTQTDSLGPQQRLRYKQVGSGARLPTGCKVLADPCLLETEFIQSFERTVRADAMASAKHLISLA